MFHIIGQIVIVLKGQKLSKLSGHTVNGLTYTKYLSIIYSQTFSTHKRPRIYLEERSNVQHNGNLQKTI